MPRRPRLPLTADTNAAGAYETWGRMKISTAPDSAAAAFFWASRLDPWRASSYYERGVALLLTHAQRPEYGAWMLPWTFRQQFSEAELRLVDSLNQLAMVRDPFLTRDFDHYLSGSPPRSVIRQIRDPETRGSWAFALGEYDSALVDLGRALAKHPEHSQLRVLRAMAFFHQQQYDSTAAELDSVVSRLTASERKDPVVFYHSKAMIHYAVGIALVQKDDERAQQHFEQALVEDLSFYMARVRLAGIALMHADTVSALASLEQAMEIDNDDATLQYFYGVLQRNRDRAAARKALERAVHLVPEYAQPHLQLAILADVRGDTAAALAAYGRFIALAPSGDADIATAKARQQALARPLSPR